ncbi:phosphotransferase family protein [Halobium salinum]|uniref:Phosphotransferase family protein n=1 Tax=Halobium salinum TaxID=1364940 RepID=A0ABD5PBQ5_9EURY|nr:phosphotransferase [Halobium salinum]
MQQDVHDALASRFDTHRVVRALRAVPPHEVWEVGVDGRRAVLKRDTGPTGNAAVEGRVTAFVGDRTSVPVPEVLHVGDDCYVAAWHPDAPAPDAAETAGRSWARAAGRGLATLHEETESLVGRYGRFDGAGGVLSVDGDADWHAAAVDYVRRRRPAMDEHGHGAVADAVVDFLVDRPDAFAGADGPVCCHGWATPEHVAVDDGEVACVVDFEHALAAPGEFDYWRTVLPTFQGDEAGRRAFREGYESVRTLPSGFGHRRPLYVLLNEVYYVESLYVQNRLGAEEKRERAAWLEDRIRETVERLR